MKTASPTQLQHPKYLDKFPLPIKQIATTQETRLASLQSILPDIYSEITKIIDNSEIIVNPQQINTHIKLDNEDAIQLAYKTISALKMISEGYVLKKTTSETDNACLQETQENYSNTIVGQLKNKVKSLQLLLKETEKNAKTLQLKLLNNIKKLNQQMSEKDLELKELRQIIAEKDEEVESLRKTNDKKYWKIRQLEEDIYDLQLELQNNNEELMMSKNCSAILEKKLSKYPDVSDVNHEPLSNNSFCGEFNLASQLSKIPEEFSDIQKQQHIEKIQQEVQTQDFEEQQSIQSKQLSDFLESKENKYLQSIQRLTFELSEAYEKINELKKDPSSSTIASRKSRTTSTYFSKKR